MTWNVMEARSAEPNDVLTVQEVASYLKVTTKTVYTLLKASQLPHFRVGRAVRCRRVDVESFIAQGLSQHREGAHR